jgi:hypothetical protein
MDYYEELGIDRSASPEEIRQAYKHLVRLLHPDHCSDNAVRPLADLQMKRLNGVLRILTNPVEREMYDRSIFGGQSQQGFEPVLRPPIIRRTPPWFWPVAGVSLFLALVVLLAYTPLAAPRQVVAPEPNKPVPAVVSKKAMNPGTSRGASAQGYGQGHLPPGPKQEPSLSAEPEEIVPTASPPVTPANDAPVPSEVATPIAPLEQSSGNVPSPVPILEPSLAPTEAPFSGVWLLLPSPHSKSAGLYPPEYIELSLTEVSGTLRGRYLARYHIPDQAISPVVAFQFEGQAGPDRANLPWSGPGGARGEIRLRLLTRETLEATWVANQLSGELSLISGTATLVRKRE